MGASGKSAIKSNKYINVCEFPESMGQIDIDNVAYPEQYVPLIERALQYNGAFIITNSA